MYTSGSRTKPKQPEKSKTSPTMIKINPECKKEKRFWIYAITAIIVPRGILKILSKLHRKILQKRKAKRIERGDYE